MHTAPQRILIEFLWLTLSITLTFLLAVFLFGWTFLKAEFGSWLPLTSLFFSITFIVYSVKAFKGKSTAYKSGKYGLLTIGSTPFKNAMAAIEFQWGERESFNGFTSDETKIQISIKYSFSQLFNFKDK